jgi:two-component system alkaline phosphatase synthesis response regulator PhoP
MVEFKSSGLVCVVDDDANVRKLATIALKESGFEVHEFANGADLLESVKHKKPDVIILDWMMSPLDGLTICGRLRIESETRKIPVMMLTARDEEVDRILGLESGADDYVTKPFSVKELVARTRALIRRADYAKESIVEDTILSIGKLKINLANRTVMKGDKFLNLTMKEFDLLKNLVNEKSKVLTREQLMSRVWSSDFCGDARAVDVHIRYLRQKVEDEPDTPRYVRTVRGIGYRIASVEELRF